MASQTSSGSGSNRKFSQTSNLKIWVSKWKYKDVEKELHISVSAKPVIPSFILQKINATEPSKGQSEYIQKIKCYLEPIDLDLLDLFEKDSKTIEGTPLSDVLKEVFEKVKRESNMLIKDRMEQFLSSFTLLKYQCEVSDESPLYKDTYTNFIGDLAELCFLKTEFPRASKKAFQSVWANFRGLEKAISEPDIRFRKLSVPQDRCYNLLEKRNPSLVVSVVEVINSGEDQNYGKGKSLTRKKLMSTELTSADDTESTSADDAESTSSVTNSTRYRRRKVNSNDENHQIPTVYPSEAIKAMNLPNHSSNVFGQHAGELLFDLHIFFKDTDCDIVRMPGLIIIGVEVIFTLLEMQYDHLRKLRENEDLDVKDQAVMYYSRKFHILKRPERNIILDYFIKLNNMVGYGYKDTGNKSKDENESGLTEPVAKVQKRKTNQTVHDSTDCTGDNLDKPIHALMQPLSWLLGKWRIEQGNGKFPTLNEFTFGGEMEFFHVGQPNIEFKSYTFHPETKKPMHREVGYVRRKPGTNEIALIIAHNNGICEVEEGTFTENEIKVESHNVGRLSFGKEPQVRKVRRHFIRKGDNLENVIYMETSNTSLTEHLRIQYNKVTG